MATACGRSSVTSTRPSPSRASWDAVVVEHGTQPVADLFHALAPLSRNGGRIDARALAQGTAQPDPEGKGPLVWRIGDAVSHRGIHAAILDARRLCQAL